MLLPGQGSALRRALDEWLDRLDLAPDIVGEIGDSALLQAFGQAGVGAFAAPTAVAREIATQYDLAPFGAAEEVRERFWAISAERRIRHPAVGAVVAAAKTLFL